jgi:hypothetical protein
MNRERTANPPQGAGRHLTVAAELPGANARVPRSGPRQDCRDMIASVLVGRSGPRATRPQTDSASETVRCIQGANEQNLPIQGRTVAWVRRNLAHSLNLSPFSIALVNRVRVDDDHALKAGNVLEFLVTNGMKGLGEVFSPESLIERMKNTREDFEDMVASGLPVHRMRDGSLRISETELDRFLEMRAAREGESYAGGLGPLVGPAGPLPTETPSLKALVEDLDTRLSAIQASLSTLIQQRVAKDYYTTEEVAKIVDRDAYTVREWCRYGRLRSEKRVCGRGKSPEWSIPHDELVRYQNEGLLPLRK